ncbi:CD82 antigen-like isoform 2-T3 [Aulostomus maculatus]
MVGTALLLIGGVVMAVSVVGFLGTRSENRFLLLMYLGGLLVLLLGQLFVLLLLVFNKYQLEDSLDTAVDGMILHYGNNHSRQDRLLDNLQQHGMCCGRTGNSDWLKNSFIQTFNLTGPFILPCSCFSSYHRGNDTPWCSELLESRRVLTGMVVGPGNDPYHQGCRDKLIDWLQENTLTIAGMDVSLIVVQVAKVTSDLIIGPLSRKVKHGVSAGWWRHHKFCCRSLVWFCLQVLQAVLGLSLYRTFGQKAASKRTNPQVDADSAHPDSTTNSHFAEQSLAYVDTEWEDTESTHPELHHGNPLACHLDNQSHIDSS